MLTSTPSSSQGILQQGFRGPYLEKHWQRAGETRGDRNVKVCIMNGGRGHRVLSGDATGLPSCHAPVSECPSPPAALS